MHSPTGSFESWPERGGGLFLLFAQPRPTTSTTAISPESGLKQRRGGCEKPKRVDLEYIGRVFELRNDLLISVAVATESGKGQAFGLLNPWLIERINTE